MHTNFFILSGGDDFLIQTQLKKIVSKCSIQITSNQNISLETHSLNCVEITGLELQQILADSLFITPKLLIVHQIDKAKNEVYKIWKSYFKDPNTNIHIVFTYNYFGKKNKIPTILTELSIADDNRIDVGQITNVLQRIKFVELNLSQLGVKKFTQGVLRLIVDYVGNDTRALANACKQIVDDLVLSQKNTNFILNENMIEVYYAGKASISAYQLAQQVLVGEIGQSLIELRRAVLLGVPILVIADALANIFHDLLLVGTLSKKDLNEYVKKAKIPIWRINQLKSIVNKWDKNKIAIAVKHITNLNLLIKGFTTSPIYELEKTFLAISRILAK